jgi:hypothetical protein
LDGVDVVDVKLREIKKRGAIVMVGIPQQLHGDEGTFVPKLESPPVAKLLDLN